MAWSVAGCLQKLLDEINTLAPGRSKSSDGSIGDPAHSARKSDHNPDSRGIVHARDFTHDPRAGADMHKIAEELRLKRDHRIKYVIWSSRMFASYDTPHRRAWAWGRYTGSNAHAHHMHVSVLSGVQIEKDLSDWLQGGDHTMTPEQEKKLDAVLAFIGDDRDTGKTLFDLLLEKVNDRYVDGIKTIREEIAALDIPRKT